MARIPYPDTNKLPSDLRDTLKKANLNVFTMWAHSVSTAELIVELGATQFAKLELSRTIRELVTLLGARANSAEYEWVQHVPLAKAAGITGDQIYAIERGVIDADHFSPQELAALRFAAAVEAGPTVPDAVFNAAREQLGDRQLVELVGLVGYYWMLGRIATVFQVDLDPPKGTEVFDAGLKMAAGGDR